MEYKWKQTAPEVYRAIYNNHKEDLAVFEGFTEMGVLEEGDIWEEKLKAQVTAWGFKDAECPIIRSELRDFNTWLYYICIPLEQDN